jgi:hypothetical protein
MTEAHSISRLFRIALPPSLKLRWASRASGMTVGGEAVTIASQCLNVAFTIPG